MKTKSTSTAMITAARVAAQPDLKEPKIGDSVHFGFVTDGNGKRIKGGSEIPFDKISALYSEKGTGNNGNPVYTVRVASGDAVKITSVGKSAWEAVA